ALPALARELRAEKRVGGHVAVLDQLLADAQTRERLAPETPA
ncbi:TetR family transcriptional regulator, partial [Streptomyces varsoviensis]